MKDLSKDFSKIKTHRVVTINPKTGWTDFTDTNNPNRRIMLLKFSVNKYNKTGYLHKRLAQCGNPNDLVFITTEINYWNSIA